MGRIDVSSTPTAILVDSEGKILDFWIGSPLPPGPSRIASRIVSAARSPAFWANQKSACPRTSPSVSPRAIRISVGSASGSGLWERQNVKRCRKSASGPRSSGPEDLKAPPSCSLPSQNAAWLRSSGGCPRAASFSSTASCLGRRGERSPRVAAPRGLLLGDERRRGRRSPGSPRSRAASLRSTRGRGGRRRRARSPPTAPAPSTPARGGPGAEPGTAAATPARRGPDQGRSKTRDRSPDGTLRSTPSSVRGTSRRRNRSSTSAGALSRRGCE